MKWKRITLLWNVILSCFLQLTLLHSSSFYFFKSLLLFRWKAALWNNVKWWDIRMAPDTGTEFEPHWFETLKDCVWITALIWDTFWLDDGATWQLRRVTSIIRNHPQGTRDVHANIHVNLTSSCSYQGEKSHISFTCGPLAHSLFPKDLKTTCARTFLDAYCSLFHVIFYKKKSFPFGFVD